jgi:hypothetical protein
LAYLKATSEPAGISDVIIERVYFFLTNCERITLDQGVSCFAEAVACTQAVLAKFETPWARCVD